MLTEILEIKNIKSVENITNKTHPREDRLFKSIEIKAKIVGWLQGNSVFQTPQNWCTCELRNCDSTRKTCTRLSQTEFHTEKGNWTQYSTINQETVETDWQMEYKYSPVECHWVISMTLQDPMCSSWPTQNGTFVNFFFHLFGYF